MGRPCQSPGQPPTSPSQSQAASHTSPVVTVTRPWLRVQSLPYLCLPCLGRSSSRRIVRTPRSGQTALLLPSFQKIWTLLLLLGLLLPTTPLPDQTAPRPILITTRTTPLGLP